MNDALVTVYIPTCNRLRLLKRAIHSVFNQDYRSLEILVVDDNSTDGTKDYLERLQQLDGRLRCFLKSENTGACLSRNIAIAEARGRYITGLDDDDIFRSDRISSFVDAWKSADDNVVALYAKSEVLSPGRRRTLALKKRNVRRKDLLVSNAVGNQIFTLTENLRAIGGFDPRFPAWQDLECWYRLLANEQKVMKLVPKRTYVVDTTHAHERISTKPFCEIEEALRLFVATHKLSLREARLMSGQLYWYSSSGLSLKTIATHLWKTLNIRSTLRLARKWGGNSLAGKRD